MSDQGTAFSTDTAGGLIDASPPTPVTYDATVVQGPMPRDQETVFFNRAPGSPQAASSVRVASLAADALPSDLQEVFDA